MSNRSRQTRSRTVARAAGAGQTNRTTWWIFGGLGVVVVAVLVAALLAAPSNESDFAAGEVSLSGESLPPLVDPANDDAVGRTIPAVAGENFEGETVEIAPDGEPKVITFLAHWCGHCQAEVPVVQDWIDENGMPEDVGLYSVVTRNDRTQGNWPPDEWLEDEGWTVPVLVDSDTNEIANALGLSGTPMYVVVDGEGDVVTRASGEIGADGFVELIETARSTGDDDAGTG
ncbi:MAG: TlpA disulfide reductase family protein [Acidimicrobiia bacterium]|nr:TlpA disulfide reductase family protein [Acidimicrobiia bacterium]